MESYRNNPSPYIKWVSAFMNAQKPGDYSVFKVARVLQDCMRPDNYTAPNDPREAALREEQFVMPADGFRQIMPAEILCFQALYACDLARQNHPYGEVSVEMLKADVVSNFQPFMKCVLDHQLMLYKEIIDMPEDQYKELFTKDGQSIKAQNGSSESPQFATRKEVAAAVAEGYGWGIIKSVMSAYPNMRVYQALKGGVKNPLSDPNSYFFNNFMRKIVGEMPREAVDYISREQGIGKQGFQVDSEFMSNLFEKALHPKSEKVPGNTANTLGWDIKKINDSLKTIKPKEFKQFLKSVDEKWLDHAIKSHFESSQDQVINYEARVAGNNGVHFDLEAEMFNAAGAADFYTRLTADKPKRIGDEWSGKQNQEDKGYRKASLPVKGSTDQTDYKEGRKVSTGEVLRPPAKNTGGMLKKMSGTIKSAVSGLRSKKSSEEILHNPYANETSNASVKDNPLHKNSANSGVMPDLGEKSQSNDKSEESKNDDNRSPSQEVGNRFRGK